jgi:predicted dehydrogenase
VLASASGEPRIGPRGSFPLHAKINMEAPRCTQLSTGTRSLPAEAPQRWGIIGLGSQANGIARALESLPGVELAGCLSSTRERTEEFAGNHDCVPYHTHEAFFGAGFDIVAVAGVNAEHAKHCVAALQAGSAVLCEKPFTLRRADAARVLEVAAVAARPVYVGYHYRFRVLALELRAMVRRGEIGEVRDIHMQRTSEQVTGAVQPWRHDLARAGAGVMCDVGVHLVDFVTWLTDRSVSSVAAVATPPRSSGTPDEHIVVSLELDNGALATLDAARSLPNGDNSLQIHGTEGSLITGPLRWVDHMQVELRRGKGEPRMLRSPVNAPLVDEVAAVRDALRGITSERLATGDDGLAGSTVLETTIEALSTGTRITLSAK